VHGEPLSTHHTHRCTSRVLSVRHTPPQPGGGSWAGAWWASLSDPAVWCCVGTFSPFIPFGLRNLVSTRTLSVHHPLVLLMLLRVRQGTSQERTDPRAGSRVRSISHELSTLHQHASLC
jgi:hypothetical protein